jgi:hypothetical protein
MKNRRLFFLTTLLLAGLGLILGARLAHAAPITYTETFIVPDGELVTGSGNIFLEDNQVTITAVGNTNNVTCGSSPTPTPHSFCQISSLPATFTLDTGSGPVTGTFTDTFSVYDYQSGGSFSTPYVAMFTGTSPLGPTSIGTSATNFSTVTLMASTVPISGLIFPPGVTTITFATSGGNLILGGFNPSSTTTFQATRVVPEPASSSLLLVGILALGLRARMRRISEQPN